jgi:hypothetical protein
MGMDPILILSSRTTTSRQLTTALSAAQPAYSSKSGHANQQSIGRWLTPISELIHWLTAGPFILLHHIHSPTQFSGLYNKH